MTSSPPHFAAVPPSRAELYPPTLCCCSPLTRRSQPFNSSLLFSPHPPNSNFQQFAPVLPSCAKVKLSTLLTCYPLTPLRPVDNTSQLHSLQYLICSLHLLTT